jgi:hypothetical protein
MTNGSFPSGPLHTPPDPSEHGGLHHEVRNEEERPKRQGQAHRPGPVPDDEPGPPALHRLEHERPAAVPELGPQPLLPDPFGLGSVVGEEEEAVGLDGPNGGALLTDHLADLGVLVSGMISKALWTPSLSAQSRAYQPARP